MVKLLYRKFGIIGLVVAFVVNMPPLRYFTDFGTNYQYSTKEGFDWWEINNFAPTFKGVRSNFNDYKMTRFMPADTVLYRTFAKNPLKFWRWYDYLFHPRYQLPYIDPEQVPNLSRQVEKRYEVSLDSLLRAQGRRVTY